MTYKLIAALFVALSINSVYADKKKFHGAICAENKDSKECIDAKAWIRRNHPDVLVHERDRTVRMGIRARNTDADPLYGSIRACISCHIRRNKKTKEYPEITSRDHHCSGCHQAAAVKLDCFECHSTKPDKITIKRLGLNRGDIHTDHNH